jgi:hypothetical protein
MMKIGKIIAVILSVLILTSCNTKDTPMPEPTPGETIKPSDYYPLNVGNKWVYLGDGNEYASFSREVIYREGSFAQISEDNGGTVVSTVIDISDTALKAIYSSGEEYDMDNLIGSEPNTNQIIIKAPLEQGTFWTNDGNTREIINITSVATTPAGVFEECIAVKTTGDGYYIIEYYKKGLGMVLSEFHSGDTMITSSLKEYTLKH